MQPLNKEERQKAFGSFLVLFIVTIALVVLMVFFSVQVPFKQNEQLRDRIAQMDKDKNQTAVFVLKMNETMNLLREVDKADVSSEMVEIKIEQKVGELYSMAGADSSIMKSMYSNVVEVMSNLLAAKKRLRQSSGNDQTVANLQQQLDRCNSQLLQAQANNQALMLQLQQR
ncbi:MAG TPA: type VI secretion system TssO [Phnomibacter sp.]|nr:type VI secretion system TssO [Phnomibacter sp.]